MPQTTFTAVARNALPAILCFLAYAITLVISLRLLAGGVDNKTLSIIISLAPMLPALLLCLSIVGVIRRSDEMQLRLQLEALALAFVGTALLTFSYGFLENVGFPHLSVFAVLPLMCGLWMFGVLLGRLRYG